MNDYEMVTLLHPRLDEEGVEQLTAWMQTRITDAGGEIAAVVPWGRRVLAYLIKKQREATYIQLDFKLSGAKVIELDRALRLHEDVLRHQIVRKQG